MDVAEPREVLDVPREAGECAAPGQAGHDGADPHVAETDLRVRHEVEEEPDDDDEDDDEEDDGKVETGDTDRGKATPAAREDDEESAI